MDSSHVSGVGVDIVELSRMRSARFPERLAEFFLSPAERAEFIGRTDKAEYLASRWAAKEAVIKALPEKVSPQDFEIRKDGEKPYAYFFNQKHRTHKVEVSLAHSTEYAAGYAVATL